MVLTKQSTFNYVTDISAIDESNEQVTLNDLLSEDRDDVEDLTDEKMIEAAVFQQIHIPRTLQGLNMDDIDKLKKN